MGNMSAGYNCILSKLEFTTEKLNNIDSNPDEGCNGNFPVIQDTDTCNVRNSLSSDSGISSITVTDLDELDSCTHDFDSYNREHVATGLERMNNLEVSDLSMNLPKPSKKIIKIIYVFISVIVMVFLGVANTTELISFSNMQGSKFGVRDCISIINDYSSGFNITKTVVMNEKNNSPVLNISQCSIIKQIVLESLLNYDILATMCQLYDGHAFTDIRKFDNGFPTEYGFYVNGHLWFDALASYIETINVFTELIDK